MTDPMMSAPDAPSVPLRVDRFSAWLWRRFRRHYLFAMVAVAAIAVSLGLAVPSGIVVGLFLEMTVTQAVVWTALVVAAVLAGLPLALVATRPQVRALRRWLDGDHSDPLTTWEAAVAIPSLLATRAVVVFGVLLLLTAVPLAWVLARPPWYGLIGLVGGVLSVTVVGSIVIASGLYLLIRPVLDEWRHLMPADVLPPRGPSITDRYLVAVGGLCVVMGLATTSAVLATEAEPRDYVISVAVSLGLGVYFTLLFNIGLVRPTVTSLNDLTTAALRIRRGDLSRPVPVSTDEELGELAVAFNEMQKGLAERETLRAAFGSYVDPSLAARLLESGSSVFEGQQLVVSVLFADVRDFTSFSDGVEPAEAVALLNRLFDVIVPVLHHNGGHANHYLGDGLLAVFGAPQPLERHADAAVAAAVEIQQRVRTEFGSGLRLGIGINSGPVIAGTVGGGGRHEFTVIGDTVNVAARVEQLTKDTGDTILITAATHTALSAPRPRTIKRGEHAVRGKSATVTMHAVDPFSRATR